ncbi:adenosylcobinamide amidohydrolase [Paenibacillus koleovorans]|uniref:adenosylcobinamide amidohydrolase n=1 Tax=Paenibacillus koleovorans TaxID=121608 RepID=UPI001FEC9CE4|nr:adenosylcobinamide amidohydrolase [Paenibacillus koleovorans]
MEMDTSIIKECGSFPGVRSRVVTLLECPVLLLESERPLRVLNSSIWGGGFSERRYVVNRQVLKSYMSDDPPAEMREFLEHAGFPPEETAGMLTAAWVDHAGTRRMELDDLVVSAWVTVGLGNPSRAGMTADAERLYPGTINTIVLIDGRPSDAAMVNAVLTATEAKAALLQDLGIVVGKGDDRIATGTTTDAVLIGSTGRGREYAYAGPSTRLGYLIGHTVYEAGKQAALAYLDVMARKAYLP